MASDSFKTFEPKAGVEGVSIVSSLHSQDGKPFTVNSWPYTARSRAEEDVLAAQPELKVKSEGGSK